jgi:hypothetical protein
LVGGIDSSHDLFEIVGCQVLGLNVPVLGQDAIVVRQQPEQGVDILFKSFGWLAIS